MSIIHLRSWKGKSRTLQSVLAVLVQHHTQPWLSMLFCLYSLGSRLLKYVSWHLLSFSDIVKFISPSICRKKEFCVSPCSKRINMISLDSLICQQSDLNKALLWILAFLSYSRPYSALYVIPQLNLTLNCQWQPVPHTVRGDGGADEISFCFVHVFPLLPSSVFLMTDCEIGYICVCFFSPP